MKKIYLNRMEKKTWNHININEKVMTVPYIQFKENEEIVESINDRIRKIPNPGNYTRKDQEHENNSINNIYVIEKIEEAEKKEKVNLKQENLEEILNNGKNTEHKRRYVYGKDLIQEYGKDYFLDDEEINNIITNANNSKNEKILNHKYIKNLNDIQISEDKEEKIIDIKNEGILLSNTRIVEAEKNAKVKLLYVFLGSGNQIIKHVTRVDEKAKVEISRNIFTSEKIKN